MLRRVLLPLFALIWLALPASAVAQSAIAGVVKDTSGAVLPGVTVEASSPARYPDRVCARVAAECCDWVS